MPKRWIVELSLEEFNSPGKTVDSFTKSKEYPDADDGKAQRAFDKIKREIERVFDEDD